MERDNQQGEAEGVTICDPPSESNPSGKRARPLELFKDLNSRDLICDSLFGDSFLFSL